MRLFASTQPLRGRAATVITAPVYSGPHTRPATHRAARLQRLQRGERSRTAVFTNVRAAVDAAFAQAPAVAAAAAGAATEAGAVTQFSPEYLARNVVRNVYLSNQHKTNASGWLPVEKRPGSVASGAGESVLNYVPLNRLSHVHTSLLDRAARETVTGQTRESLIKQRLREPAILCREGSRSGSIAGTPRREYQEGVVSGVRIRAVQNPYYSPNKRELRQMNIWASRDFVNSKWSPHAVAVRGGRKIYSIPESLFPGKDELGETHPPLLGARYVADVKRQFVLHGLPWIYEKGFGRPAAGAQGAGAQGAVAGVHYRDRAPKVRRRWIRRELRLAKIEQAMKNMGSLVTEYRKEKKAAKGNSWFEKIVNEIAGEQVAGTWVRKPKVSKG